MPPPDIPVPTTTQDAPVISATTTTAPTEPHVIAPPPVVQAPPAPPAPPRPAVRQGVSCHEIEKPIVPARGAPRRRRQGRGQRAVQIDEQGNVIDVQIVSVDPPQVFDRAMREALMNWKCKADGEKY